MVIKNFSTGRGLVFLLSCFLLNMGSQWGRAAGAPGLPNGWLMNPQDTEYLLSNAGVSKFGGNPRGMEQGWGFWGAAGQGRLYSLADLPVLWFEVGVRPAVSSFIPALTVSLERVGGEFLAEKSRSFLLRWGNNPRVGLKANSSSWTLDGENLEANLYGELEGRFHFELGGMLVGVVGLYLRPWVKHGWPAVAEPRNVLEIKLLGSGSGVACRVDRRFDGSPQFTFEGMLRLATGVGLGFRGDPQTGSMGGLLVIMAGGLRLETSHLVHPALGVTNRFGLGAGDPRASSR
jgi:hypothetical protein